MSTQLLALENISKSYGAKVVLENVALTLRRGERVGLVGENGSGKTTLARILLGELAADGGTYSLMNGAQIGYLPQEAAPEPLLSVQAFLERALGDLDALRAELSALEAAIAAPNAAPAQRETLLARYGDLQEMFTLRGGYESDYRLAQVTDGLDLAHIKRERLLGTLSGGEKTRMALASLLLRAPDLLILDEPTNHLDAAATAWLEDYLCSYGGAVLLISHDRHFLNRVVTGIAELSPHTHTLTHYHGNYDAYRAERARRYAQQAAAYEAQQEEMRALQRLIKTTTHNTGNGKPRSDNDKFAKGFFAGRAAVHERRLIRNAERRLETLEREAVAAPPRQWQINPTFSGVVRHSQAMLRAEGVYKAYGEQVVLADVSFTVRGGDHVVICGANGVGKTTLIRLLLNLEMPDSGTLFVAPNAQVGYLDQALETLDPHQSAFEAYAAGRTGAESVLRAELHRYGLFGAAEVEQLVGSLSFGQRRKLQIARLIAAQPDVLLLDEPTNHLDLESIERFEAALCAFRGTIIAVSHDRAFIEKVGRQVWHLAAGKLRQA
ncbi:MAG: ABC transporter ATP-binding protein [Chloroflexi bacterium CFX4]|nr:ABC transporter ATP-binding protein [Chloroflexi bacterium CFX4]MDL1923715.1 ABC-F family ATP-binding cassette domain-containing protein [Chloroflexi bacterium CFX3]